VKMRSLAHLLSVAVLVSLTSGFSPTRGCVTPPKNAIHGSMRRGDETRLFAKSSHGIFGVVSGDYFKKAAVGLATSLMIASNLAVPLLPVGDYSVANAAESRLVGEIKGSGLVFKDTLNIERFDDPKVQGVTLYVSNFQRPITERLQKDFFSDPSFASVGCAKTGPVKIADNIAIGSGGEEVFEESRSLLFKTLRVQRIYDKEKNTVVYVSFNTRLDKDSDSNKSRFKSSICAVNLD
jgi:CreA protein